MKRRLLVLFLTATTGYAQRAKTPDPIQSLDWIVGRWECRGVTPAGKVDYTFSQEIERSPGSRWFRFRAFSPGGRLVDTAFQTCEPRTHRWRYFAFYDSGAYSMGTAPDFSDNQQTWTGDTYENGARKPWGRIVFTKVSDHEKRENFYPPGKNGKDEFKGSEICTKRK